MAKIGMEYVVAAILHEDEQGKATYTDGRYIGPSSAFNMNTNNNDVKDFGDNRVVESDTTLNYISVSAEVNQLGLELECFLLGHEYDEEKKECDESTLDVAPYLGFGFVGMSRSEGKTIYRAVWLKKVQFAAPADDNSTKTENTTFNHSTLEGSAYELADHTIRKKSEHDTLDDAKAWLNELAGITA